MVNSNDKSTKTLLDELDRFAYFMSIGVTLLLIIVYILFWQWQAPNNVLGAIRDFALALISNFIPVFVLFAISYALFRRIQTIKSRQEMEETVDEIVRKTTAILIDQLKGIEENLGVRAWFITDLRRKDAVGNLYREATALVEKAEREILILWHHHLQRSETGESAEEPYERNQSYQEERKRFFDTILRKCQQHRQSTLFYRRIMQFGDSIQSKDSIPSKLLTVQTADHCRELLEFSKKYPDVAILKGAPIFLEQTLMLVDERFILWEIDAIDPDTKRQYFDGALIFDDRDKKLSSYIRDFFMKIDAHSVKVTQIVD